MHKFSGWMMRAGKTFDAATVQAWLGAQVQTRKYSFQEKEKCQQR